MEINDKNIRKTVTIKTTVDTAWISWTTYEGLKSFFGIENEIELCIGGKFEIYFLMNNPIGLRGSENCKILSYLPQEMLSFSWNAPPQYKAIRESNYKTWVVVNFKRISERKTEVSLNHIGWPNQNDWNDVFNYFDKAWEQVLNDFKALFNENE